MKNLSLLLSAALVCGVFTSSADAGAKKKKTSATGDFAGEVASITKGEGTDASATLTIKVPGPKKKSPAVEHKFELAKGVKLETLTIAKKAFGIKAAQVEDIKVGERVMVQMKEGSSTQVERVLLINATKKKKAAAS